MTSAVALARRPRFVPVLVAIALFALALVFHRPLLAWFIGPQQRADAKPPTAPGAGADHADAGDIDHYTCSMHPSVRQAGPGKCPICGMDLVPVTKQQEAEGVVSIDEARRQLIGVRTGPVIEGPASDTFHATGLVAYDESGLADVNLKVRGWITHLSVSKTGERVGKGQTLFTMYSPEMYQAQQDFLLATRGEASSLATDAGGRALASLGRAARERLRLLGMSDAELDAVATRGAPDESVTVSSPASGFVIEKNVVEGAAIDPGMRLYRIAALDHVWVEADVYEADLSRVRVGQSVKVTLDYLPGASYAAKVTYISPFLDDKTRTGKVRVVLANRDLELRPGMYATIELAANARTRLRVPASAVVYTGPRRLVFVDMGEGRFKPQEIRVGVETDGMYEVLSGLQKDDRVATSGVFLLAAEARIRTAATYWSPPKDVADADRAETPALSIDTHPQIKIPAPSRDRSPAPAASASSEAIVFQCPMHPEVQSSTPGKCPKCGMDLQPIGGTP